MKDGQGNLIGPDGYLYPQWWVTFGRDWQRGPGVWSLAFYWGLKDDALPGECVYAHQFEMVLSWYRQ